MMTNLTTFLEKIAGSQSSFILFEDRVYDILEFKKEEKGEAAESRNAADFLELDDLKFSLKPSLRYSDFERLDENTQKKSIEEYSKKYVESRIKAQLKSRREVEDEAQKVKILQFIMGEFLPYFLRKKYETDTFIGIEELIGQKFDPVGKARREITDKLKIDFPFFEAKEKEDPVLQLRNQLLENEVSRINNSSIIPQIVDYSEKDGNGTKPSFVSSDLGNILGHQPIYIFNGEAFQLKLVTDLDLIDNTKTSERITINIKGRQYVPSYKHRLPLETICSELLSRKKCRWHITSLERNQDAFEEVRESLSHYNINEMQLQEMLKRKEYDLGNCGFSMHGGDFYVFTRVPKFATQDGRNPEQFWPYDTTKIGIQIGWNEGEPYTSGKPKCLEKRETHPCLANRDSDRQLYDICNLSREDSSYENTLSDMVRKLSDGVNVMLHPLSKESLDSHKSHMYFGTELNQILKQKPLTREEAIALGYNVIEVISQTVGSQNMELQTEG